MKKQEHPQKKIFFDLLHRAVRKDEKVSRETKKHQKSGDYTDKRTRQHKTEDVS